MTDLLRYVDPFHGNGTIELPEPEGIAATWFFIKAQTGNTHPGACLPFGMVSACAYSGAYVMGYGLNAPNTHARPPHRFDDYVASGFSHFHLSGTGSIGTYYNYCLVTPLGPSTRSGSARNLHSPPGLIRPPAPQWRLENEVARPGYYAATLAGTGIRAELTVSAKAALHRYTFPRGPARISVDISAGGIGFPKMETIPTAGEVHILSEGSAQGYVCMAGMPIYMYLECDRAEACQAWVDQETVDARQLSFDRITEQEFRPFGLIFDLAGEGRTLLRIGFSLRGYDQARENARPVQGSTFEAVAAQAQEMWSEHIQRVQVKGGTEAEREVFYSCLYHSLVKPNDFTGESPFWTGKPYWVDFATLWDQYKTQLPLMLTCYPERGASAVNGLLAMGEHVGEFLNAIILNAFEDKFDKQARGLTHHIIADAYHRGVEGIDYRQALALMVADIRKEGNHDFLQRGIADPYTHTLDLADACACTAMLAQGLLELPLAAEMWKLASQWRNVYDRVTGRLSEASWYYEGGPWNYSFRLLHDMAGRISLYPREADFVADLDRFFGYGAEPVQQPQVPGDRDYMAWGHSLNRFEGYNNEPDIETPYNYLYAGRPDRTAEVVRAGIRYMFTTGRGGLPGNDDSGGLSSCHVWNAVGLFPVTGKPVMLIGSPLFEATTLQVGDRAFCVEAVNNSPENIYVQRAALNDQPLDRAYLAMDEFLAGGTLRLEMGPEPSDWATRTRPPSYTERSR